MQLGSAQSLADAESALTFFNMSNKKVVIVSAARTPVAKFHGGFSTVPAHELGAAVIKEVLKRANVPKDDVSEVVLGQVLTAGQGQNPARQATIAAGLKVEIPSWIVNQLCGSGLRAVALGAQQIQTGDADIVIAGGQESMSLSPHCLMMRVGVKFGDVEFTDTMMKDGLVDAFQHYHMGITAENVAKEFKVSREDQDKFSLQSQKHYAAALAKDAFKDEIVTVNVTKGRESLTISKDEFPRPGCTIEAFEKLRPAFLKDGTGTVTAGNASGINDGAAAVLLMSELEATRRGLHPLAHIVASANVGVDPTIMGIGPISAIKKVLKKAIWNIDDVDLFEINEAFASQSVAVVQELGLDEHKVNVNGGAIAIGHPIGASGCRILVTLIYAMKARNLKKGVAALCVGGGQGVAMCVELP